MLKTNITLGDNKLAIRFEAVNQDEEILVSARHILAGKWIVETYVNKEQLGNQVKHFNHPGAAIEAFSKVVNKLDDYLRQRDEVIKLREQLSAAEYRLGDLRNSYYSSMGE